MNGQQFLHALWGPAPPDGLLIQIWQLQGRRSSYLRTPAGAAGLCAPNIYTAVALCAKDHGPRRRARADQAAAIAGLWLDIDVAGAPGQAASKRYPPTIAAARALAHTILPPTLLVHSGGGLQAWWLFTHPWRFTCQADQQSAALAAAQWHHLHRTASKLDLDATHDLARLMRLPATFNDKSGAPKPVHVVSADGPRYPHSRLLQHAAKAGPVLPHPEGHNARAPGLREVQVSVHGLQHPKLTALLHNSSEFQDTFHHRRRSGWTLSEYDLSLCRLGASAGLSDQELADLIVSHRLTHNPGDLKSRRGEYLQRTIAKARTHTDRDQALAGLRASAYPAQTPTDTPRQ